MLSDVSNLASAPSSPGMLQNGKRPWQGQDDLQRLKVARSLEVTSSSPVAGRSSSPFPNTRLAPFDAPTSPSFSKFSTSPAPVTKLSSLPPSSPPCARHVEAELEADSSAPDDEPLVLRLERGTVMQFGRKAKRRALPTSHSETNLPIMLPKSAKNASRLHCTAKIVSPKSGSSKLIVEICVLGQNGMKIDGKLWRAGSVAMLPVQAGGKLDLGFWGWSSEVIVAESEKRVRHAPGAIRKPIVRLSSPASSVYASHFDDAAEQSAGDLSLAEDTQLSAPSSSSLPIALSPTHSELSILSSPVNPTSALPCSSRAEALVATLGLDLPGLIASQIVFSPRSTVGIEDVIKGLLKEVGAMWDVLNDGKGSEEQTEEREEMAVEEWWDAVEQVMSEEPFFGCIDNAGLKDAAGHPLLPVYFYVPDADPSSSRVEALEPFVKRVRGARTTKPVRYFWAKPSLRKNR